jgi:hypothetical protein
MSEILGIGSNLTPAGEMIRTEAPGKTVRGRQSTRGTLFEHHVRERDCKFWLAKISQRRRLSLLKSTIRIIPLLVLLLLAGVKQASAQGVSAYFGLGSATDSAGTSAGCSPQFILDNVTGNCEAAATMGGVFGVFGADFMIKPHLGVNGEYTFRFAQASYLPAGGLNIRPAFYDFNAVYQPTSANQRFVPVLEGGIGGAKLSLYFNQQSCATPTVCANFSQVVATANHFQLHGAFGVKIYVKSDIFIKPQFDIHWVDNLDQQYGRNLVPQYTVSIGYTFGRQ